MIKTNNIPKNAIATSLVENAYKLHCLIYHHIYQFPVHFHFKHDQISLKVDDLLQIKYIPWLTVLIFITTLIGFNSCIFVLLLKFIHRKIVVDVVATLFIVFLASSWFFEWATYLTYCKSTEMEVLINRLFELERTRKLSMHFLFLKSINS